MAPAAQPRSARRFAFWAWLLLAALCPLLAAATAAQASPVRELSRSLPPSAAASPSLSLSLSPSSSQTLLLSSLEAQLICYFSKYSHDEFFETPREAVPASRPREARSRAGFHSLVAAACARSTSFAGGLNLYGYTDNNPIGARDPEGLQSITSGFAGEDSPEPDPTLEEFISDRAASFAEFYQDVGEMFAFAPFTLAGNAYRGADSWLAAWGVPSGDRDTLIALFTAGTAVVGNHCLFGGGGRSKSIPRRKAYLGKNPPKKSRTGRQVTERMMTEGRVRNVAWGPEVMHTSPDGKVTWHPFVTTDMGHINDAVSWWNSTGRFFGPHHREVRRWMLDANNYELEPKSINRSRGAILGKRERYLPPVKRREN